MGIPKSRLASGLLILQLIASCGGGDDAANSDAGQQPGASAPAPEVDRAGSYFFGSTKIGAESFFSEAFVGRDGTIRLHIEDQSGLGNSMQFYGRVERRTNQLVGTGVIIGQRCSQPFANRFCGHSAVGEFTVRLMAYGAIPGLEGELRIRSNLGDEVWPVSFAGHDLFLNRLGASDLQANYLELAAEFARNGDTIVSVDAAGKILFQSAGSGCMGYGSLEVRDDESFNLFDVSLRIESCNPAYAHLNGDFAGLASPVADGWDYGHYLLRIMLSSADTSAVPVAIAMSGRAPF